MLLTVARALSKFMFLCSARWKSRHAMILPCGKWRSVRIIPPFFRSEIRSLHGQYRISQKSARVRASNAAQAQCQPAVESAHRDQGRSKAIEAGDKAAAHSRVSARRQHRSIRSPTRRSSTRTRPRATRAACPPPSRRWLNRVFAQRDLPRCRIAPCCRRAHAAEFSGRFSRRPDAANRLVPAAR